MDVHAWIAVGTLVVAMVLFITKLIPLEATALSIPVVLAVTGTIDPADAALKGFGNGAVIALGGIFILSAGLKESGVATLMARLLQRVGGKSPFRLTVLIMITTAVLSAVMSNAATVAVFLPAVIALGLRAGIPNSRLMMPLAYSAILGGTLTLISTTPNLILAGELDRLTNGARELGMFEFGIVGVPVAAIGIVYMALVGCRMLPKSPLGDREKKDVRRELESRFRVRKHLYRMRVTLGSRLVGKTIGESGIGLKYEVEIAQVLRMGGIRRRYFDATPALRLEQGDVLYVDGRPHAVRTCAETEGLEYRMAGRETVEKLLGRGLNFAEVTISPHSECFGRDLKQVNFRGRFGLTVLAIWRQGEAIEKGIADTPLLLGDTLLVYGPDRKIRRMHGDDDFVVLARPTGTEDVRCAPVALIILALALLPPVFKWLPLSVSALGAALLMVGTRCVSLRAARRAVDWRILFLIIGTIPLGDALYQTGVAERVAASLFPADSGVGPLYVFGMLFLVAAILSTTSNNAAAAVILAPVALSAAASSGVDVHKAFLAVAYGTSCAFILPFAHQCNLMVMGPGGYSTKDFAKVGIGLSIVMGVSAVTLLTVL
ncbi:MAG: SLC13 family permease [Planctomycetota bacterium]